MTIERTLQMKRKSIRNARPDNKRGPLTEENTCLEVCQKKSTFAITSSRVQLGARVPMHLHLLKLRITTILQLKIPLSSPVLIARMSVMVKLRH